MAQGEQVTPVILGVPWQRAYNAIPIWQKDGIQLTVKGKDIFEPFLGEECYLPDSEDEEEPQLIAMEQEDKQPPTQSGTATENGIPNQTNDISRTAYANSKQVWIPKKLKIAQKGRSHIWVPKKLGLKTTKPVTPPQLQYIQAERPSYGNTSTQPRRSTAAKQIWVKTDTLKAQGYYEGASQIWIPKRSKPMRQKQVPKSDEQQAPTDNIPKHHQRSYLRWAKRSTLTAQGYYTGTSQLWLQKGPTKPTYQHEITTRPMKALLPPQQRWQPKKQENHEIKPTIPEMQRATWQEKGKWVPQGLNHHQTSLHMIPEMEPTTNTTNTSRIDQQQQQVTKLQLENTEEQVEPPIIHKLKPAMATQARNLFLSVFSNHRNIKDLA